MLPTSAQPTVVPSFSFPTATPTAFTTVVIFEGDYESVVTNKENFLAECSAYLAPVECIDVREGSIVVTLRAKTASQMTEATTQISDEGLSVPGYPALYTLESQQLKAQASEDSSGLPAYAVILICLAVVVVMICGIKAIFMLQGKDKKIEEESFSERVVVEDKTAEPTTVSHV